MDSKYNTNSYKMPFFSISKLTNEGHIYILSKAFLSNEKKDTFIWAISFLKSVFGNVDSATMDGCRELINATKLVYP